MFVKVETSGAKSTVLEVDDGLHRSEFVAKVEEQLPLALRGETLENVYAMDDEIDDWAPLKWWWLWQTDGRKCSPLLPDFG
ncbi:hypothetical protein DIPPA_12756 [Diplonema papillatum]|nr:hypothetical protein DIPPA_12756 [Diplonema papillatum]